MDRRASSRSAPLPAPLPRWLLPVAVVVAILATLATTTAALGATTRLAAACDGVILRTRPSTSATVVTRISAGVRVTAVDRVRGGRWTTRCKGFRDTGRGWYRISVVRKTSVR
ncbi:MAG TPA: SH3 domain-containing protein, partial [Candidatus Limnocylindrales bacterium]|nr:SH3 domain-containing protein [Candidatus Limnocylindrales bacterium]